MYTGITEIYSIISRITLSDIDQVYINIEVLKNSHRDYIPQHYVKDNSRLIQSQLFICETFTGSFFFLHSWYR